MTYAEALRLLEMFHGTDTDDGPHFYIRSHKASTWVRPKGMRIMASSGVIAILHCESEDWELIPWKEIDFGVW
jgi:hypothetical protein